LDILDAHGMKATFFVIGDSIRANPGIAKETLRRGHQLASHGYLHHVMDTFTAEQVFQEVYRWEETFLNFGINPDKIPNYYRIRSGQQTPTTKQVIESMGYTTVHWAILNGDTGGLNADQIWTKWNEHFQDGSTVQSSQLVPIFQQHDRNEPTAATMQAVADYWKRVMPNAQFVTIAECLGLPAYRDAPPRTFLNDPTCANGKLSSDGKYCCSSQCGVCGGIFI
jgi:peptidoglycan/xylan/chitin deacetylase (PgdA/CDA1 family)